MNSGCNGFHVTTPHEYQAHTSAYEGESNHVPRDHPTRDLRLRQSREPLPALGEAAPDPGVLAGRWPRGSGDVRGEHLSRDCRLAPSSARQFRFEKLGANRGTPTAYKYRFFGKEG